jgi:general stress protein CsbA
MAVLPDATAARRLRSVTVVVLVLNVVAAVVAVVVNLPAQFGGVGTDAGDELLSRGTAISAPVFPVVLMVLVVVLAPRRDRWSWVGIALACLLAISVGIGGYGEMVADPTADTSSEVLIGAGVAWLGVAAVLLALATLAVVRARRTEGTAA